MKFLILSIVALVCVSSVLGKSECEKHRERELRMSSKFAGYLIPRCDANGDYEQLQCHGDENEPKRACQCWAKDGKILTAPSFELRTCSCIMAKHEAKQTRAATVPQCDASGSFVN